MELAELKKQETKFYNDYYGQLVGWTITSFDLVEDTEDPLDTYLWPTFTLTHHKTGNTVKVEVSQDEEGNGPGFLFIA